MHQIGSPESTVFMAISLDDFNQSQRAVIIEAVESGMGRLRLSRLLSDLFGAPVSERQAGKLKKEVGSFGGRSVSIVGNDGEANSGWMNITDDQISDEWLLEKAWLLDPEEWEIIPGTLKVSFLGGTSSPKHRRNYRACVRRSTTKFPDEELAEIINARKPFRGLTKRAAGSSGSFVVCLADLQAGKKESGGSIALQERFDQAMGNLSEHVRELKLLGRKPEKAVLLGLGDLVESCVVPGMGMSNSPFTCDLNQRQQVRLALRLVDTLADFLAQEFSEVLVAAIPGNHGERRGAGGRSYTTPGDNYDVEIFDHLKFAYSKNASRYGRVSWQIPEDDMSIVVETSGTFIGIAHGHQMGSGSTAEVKMMKWWRDRCFTRYGNFDRVGVLVTGHYHHHRYADLGEGRIWMQAPAMEGSASSEWFAERGGETGSTQGLLVFCTQDNRVTDNRVIPAEW